MLPQGVTIIMLILCAEKSVVNNEIVLTEEQESATKQLKQKNRKQNPSLNCL